MKAFAALYAALDEATGTDDKVDALARYFAAAPPSDAAWALFFLDGRKLPQPVPTRLLRQWAAEESGVPAWLFAECHAAVGDLAETIALLVGQQQTQNAERRTQNTDTASEESSAFSLQPSALLHEWVEQRLLPLR
ncbi:MAG: ATP-dependent DNA ligase, partial [Roseiflexaceae bacterium]|nr:ATP-dependent DNA ligase [Roseiflexaceae bacterium]